MPERMKILYVVTKSVWGGAQRYVFDLATRLDAGPFDVLVATGGNGPLIERLQDAGIRTESLPALSRDINPFVEIRAFWSLFCLYRRERPLIIHLSSSKAGGVGAAAALLHKIVAGAWETRVIFTVHGWPFNEDRPRWQRIIIFVASWLSTLWQDRVIIIDTADYRTARRFIPEGKLALIFHGIEKIDFLSRPSSRAFFGERIGIPIGSNDILIGVNAELTKNKGQTHLIDAAAIIRDRHPHFSWKMLFISDGEDRAKLEAKIARLGLDDHIFLPGFVTDVKRYLKGLDIFVLPSVKEGLPYAIMEAMAAGTPIIASRVGGIPDLIRSGESGLLVPPKNPDALADAIGQLIKDNALASRLGLNAAASATRSFPMHVMISRTTALYGAA